MSDLLDGWPGTPFDLAAGLFYLAVWVGYGPLIAFLAGGRSINADMAAVRLRWMRHMALRRDGRLLDGQLIGHVLNSASFFASSNLILIAATAGALFGGERTYAALRGLPIVPHAPRVLITLKVALVTVTLARSLLDFIWAIRQMNYCLSLVGAAPDRAADARLLRFAELTGRVFNSSLSTFNSGVRGYYFALAAAAWVFGPAALALATVGAATLLAYRQLGSPTARNIHMAREALEDEDEAGFAPAPSAPASTPDPAQASTPTPMGQVTPVPPIPQ